MPRKNYLFTSESVSEGHPDKVCDRISDEVVDLFYREALAQGMDPSRVRVACETLATTNRVLIAGETRGPSSVTHDKIEAAARQAIKDIGYEQSGFHWQTAKIEIVLHEQSANIAQGVDSGEKKDEGAGDQGIMFGYACDETPELMPAPIYYAQRILRLLSEARHSGKEKVLGPDSKSQVTVEYRNGIPVAATQIVVSQQHLDESLTSQDMLKLVKPYVKQALPKGWITKDTVWHVNPTGKFFIGGPDGDAGLTGRKIIVDTYGGAAPHGGGRLLRQGPEQGGPFGGLCGALSGQERGGGGARPVLHHPAFLCHRRVAAPVGLCRYARHRQGEGSQAQEGNRQGHGPFPARHPHPSQSQPADLCAHLGLRPFRPARGARRRLLLGEDRSHQGAQSRGEVKGGRQRYQLYGRRKGHALRRHHLELVETLLPKLRIDLAAPLAGLTPPVRLEIGFGGGEHLAHQAALHPDISFIGAEPFVNGVAKLLALIEEKKLANIRIHDGDVRFLLEALLAGSLERIYLLYPDPWPKARHAKRRFVNAENLGLIHRLLAPGGLFLFASDITDYVEWTRGAARGHGGFAEEGDGSLPFEDWVETRYEAKATRQGRVPAYLRFRKA